MEKDSQIKAIAEACRWELHDFKAIKDCSPLEEFLGWDADVKVWRNPAGKFVRGLLPNYLSDLNAMQSAVLSQDQHFQEQFACRLAEMRTAKRKMHHQLTASDWAEAFLMVNKATTHVDEGGGE